MGYDFNKKGVGTVYKRCTTEKAALQQRRMEECLLAAMQDKPVAEISVSSLCEKTGLSRKTFYRLFESKQDVLCSLVDRAVRDFIRFRLPKEAAVPGVSEELTAFFVYWQNQRPLLDALSKNGSYLLLFDRCILHLLGENTDILEQLGVRPELRQNRESLLFCLSGLLTLVVDWHQKGYDRTPGQMAALTEKLVAKNS